MPIVTRSAYNVHRNAINRMQILSETCRLEQICAICHDDIRGTDVYHLPRGHTFHQNCLNQQLHHGRQWATRCALCRIDHRDVILQNPELSQYLNANTQTYNFTEGVEWWRRAVVAAAPQLTNESAELLIIYLSEMNWSDDDDM